MNRWCTKEANGEPKVNAGFRLYFGPGYDTRATVTRYVPGSEFELQMTEAHVDWAKSCVGCRLTPEGEGKTRVLFYHNGWPEANEHWRVSCYCWAIHLRVLRRNVEHGESVPYEKRLEVQHREVQTRIGAR